MDTKLKRKRAKRRHKRVRSKIFGTLACPRISVFKSTKHIYAQIIDDEEGKVIVSFSSLSKEFKEKGIKGNTVEGASSVGEAIGKRAGAKGIKRVVFDRGGYPYHGRIKTLAEGIRKAGIEF